MKSTIAVVAALASTGALAQPHGHGHAHQHPARHEHQHHHDKRVLETETVIDWVYETVIEMVEGTATVWTTLPPATTFATSVLSSDGGQFFEGASTTTTTPASVAQPVETSAVSSSSSYVAEPAPEPTTASTSAYVAPEPTTSSTTSETPVVVEPTTTAEAPTTTSVAPVVEPTTSTTSAEAATTSAASSDSSSSTNTGMKITWIGDTTGAYSACGEPYEADSMFVAVDPSLLSCGSDGKGTSMTITANGKTVTAVAIDKCMGCDVDHIDVATAVYEALGYTLTDGGMHNTGNIKWQIS